MMMVLLLPSTSNHSFQLISPSPEELPWILAGALHIGEIDKSALVNQWNESVYITVAHMIKKFNQ
mgnify:CR=1 FL=1